MNKVILNKVILNKIILNKKSQQYQNQNTIQITVMFGASNRKALKD